MKYLDLAIANETIKTTDIKGKEYAEVNQRIKAFRMVYPQGTIRTKLLSNEDGICVFEADVFDNEFNLLATGHAYEKEDSSFINKTSYIENCETSAVGRALGMAGFGIDVSVASAEEIQNAINNQVITQEDADAYKFKFGKYKDQLLKDVFKQDPKYVDWMISNTQDEKLLEIIRLATGLYIPTTQEQKRKAELMAKLSQLDLDIDALKEKYEVDDLRNLSIKQLKEIVEE